jgi:2-(1,2-epoxy-1,2-dihydrophenyl)acetyl-CoA isomerase
MKYEYIDYVLDKGVARLTLNRPEKLNSLTAAMLLEVGSALDAAASDTAARVLILTGAGRGFCAGQDLGDLPMPTGISKPDLGEFIDDHYAPLVRRLRAMPKPVVCAVNGVAAGAGANIAFACDIVIAVETAKFIQPFCKLGLVPDAGGTWFLPQLVGRARALGLALLGDTLSAEQAAEWGLIWKCTSTADFESIVNTIVQQLATGPTLGFVRTKQAIDGAATSTLEAQLDREGDFQRELGYSQDFIEGVNAFMTKRPPQFIGQ